MVGLLYFSLILMVEKAQTAQDMRGLAELTLLSITLSHIVHAVQLERGASSLFLKNQGQKFTEELSEYRTQTDESITALNHFLQKFDIHDYDSDFNTRLNNVKEMLTRFQSIRADVTTLSILQPEAVKRYTEINQTLFQFIIQSTHYSNYKDVFPLKLAYLNLLKAKEKAGLERALLSAVFSQDSIMPTQFQQFAELVAVQEAYFNHDVMNYLTDEQKAFLKQQLSSGPFVEETTRMREMVYTAAAHNHDLQDKVNPAYWFAMQTGKINLLKEAGDKLAHDLYVQAAETQKAAETEFMSFLFLMIIIIGLANLFFVVMLIDTTKSLSQAVTIANQIANGNLNNQIGTHRQDETGQLSCALASMQTQLRERIELDKRIADEALRITCALDSATTHILITNANYQIIYLNETAQQLFKTHESSIRKDLPHFEVSRLYGANLDIFHKDAAKQRQILAKLTGSHSVKITLGGLTLDHIITPIMNASGERLGIVIEFNNRTLEEALASEINQVIQAGSKGDFQQRINLDDKTGFFKIFSQGVNQIMDFNQRAVLDITDVIAAFAEGDLTQQIENNYVGLFEQLKNDINTTAQKLTEIMTVILRTAAAVSHAAAEISQGNISLSQRTEEQATSLEETAANMEQMTGTIQQNADNAQYATQLATSARERAEKGGDVVSATVHAMTEISHSSQKIADIIGVIDEIAFQTNLLALNAAVEAARAGEHGRGFAVVASEVRNLAQRSANAAKEIKGLIKDSVVKVEEGTKLANQSGETLKEIVLAVTKVSDIIVEIAAASHEQSSGIHQVNQSIAQMDEMTQKNAALVEEAASASSVMKEQAQSLKEQVAFFKVGELNLRQNTETQSVTHRQALRPMVKEFPKLLSHQESEWEDF